MSKGDAKLWGILQDKFEMLRRLGKPREAMRAAETLAALARRAFGLRHPKVAFTLFELGVLEASLALPAQANEHLREAADILEHVEIADAENKALLIQIYNELAALASQSGAVIEACGFYQKAIPTARELEGSDGITLATLYNNVALLHENLQQPGQAEAAYRESLAIYERLGATENEDFATILHNYGNLLAKEGRYADARDTLTQAAELRARVSSEPPIPLAQTQSVLAVAHHGMGDLELAQQFYEKALAVFQSHLPACADDYRLVMENLGSLLRSQGKTRQADSLKDHLRRLTRRPLTEY